MLPQANQARKAIWDAVNLRMAGGALTTLSRWRSERPRERRICLSVFQEWRDMAGCRLGQLQLSGWLAARGVVFSEYALADPAAWAFAAPDLAGKRRMGGVYQYDARPQTTSHKLVEFARTSPDWYGETLTVEDTGAIPMSAIETERKELAAERGDQEAEAIIAQEYYCDADASIPGAYYGSHMTKALKEGRIGVFPWLPDEQVGNGLGLGAWR